jgi:hypothetical protein
MRHPLKRRLLVALAAAPVLVLPAPALAHTIAGRRPESRR